MYPMDRPYKGFVDPYRPLYTRTRVLHGDVDECFTAPS